MNTPISKLSLLQTCQPLGVWFPFSWRHWLSHKRMYQATITQPHLSMIYHSFCTLVASRGSCARKRIERKVQNHRSHLGHMVKLTGDSIPDLLNHQFLWLASSIFICKKWSLENVMHSSVLGRSTWGKRPWVNPVAARPPQAYCFIIQPKSCSF